MLAASCLLKRSAASATPPQMNPIFLFAARRLQLLATTKLGPVAVGILAALAAWLGRLAQQHGSNKVGDVHMSAPLAALPRDTSTDAVNDLFRYRQNSNVTSISSSSSSSSGHLGARSSSSACGTPSPQQEQQQHQQQQPKQQILGDVRDETNPAIVMAMVGRLPPPIPLPLLQPGHRSAQLLTAAASVSSAAPALDFDDALAACLRGAAQGPALLAGRTGLYASPMRHQPPAIEATVLPEGDAQLLAELLQDYIAAALAPSEHCSSMP
jgi:hypothetical protein